jgi:hypothetical protein
VEGRKSPLHLQPKNPISMKRLSLSLIRQLLHFAISCITRAIFNLLAEAETAAYSAYVRISDSRQMPKEPC